MKLIDLGKPNFTSLITNNCIYVDKTKYLYRLLTCGGTYFFCSRPRRFGKTLTINTLETIFQGRRELFKGLYIESTDYDWKEHPVIHIDFGLFQGTTAEDLKQWLVWKLKQIGLSYEIELPALPYYASLDLLVTKLAKKAPVVVLVDEYDKILSSNIYNPELEGLRDVLRGFFEVIKACYASLRFVFITGVTKFSKVSIFSSMNNLWDLSMSEISATMFGYTQQELEENFNEYIVEGIRTSGLTREAYLERLKSMYDGYRFAPGAETVYNPVSIGTFFAEGGTSFANYWVETGGTKLIMDIARKVHFNIAEDLDEPVLKSGISSFDVVEMAGGNVTRLKYKSLLLQSGYLTIKSSSPNGKELYLGFPNGEIEEAYCLKLLGVYGGDAAGDELNTEALKRCLEAGDTKGMVKILYAFYASVPYHLEKGMGEAGYQLMFCCIMKALHADINLEVATNRGRIDALLRAEGHLYIFEFKKDRSADEALSQIRETGYAEQFAGKGGTVHLVGISFSSKERNIADWKEETL